MTPKFQILDAANTVERYLAGEPMTLIAASTCATDDTVKRFLLANGVELRTKAQALALAGAARRVTLDLATAIELYESGLSPQQVAQQMGTSLGLMEQRLREAGITRTRSEALYNRYATMSLSDRKHLTRNARARCAETGALWNELAHKKSRIASAQTFERTLAVTGRGESLFAEELTKRGVTPIPQKAVGTYNIDLALPPVAVEIHCCASRPLTNFRIVKRVKYLINSGWYVLYVWVTKSHPISQNAADKVIAFYHSVCGDHPPLSKYWMIRGSGDEPTTLTHELD